MEGREGAGVGREGASACGRKDGRGMALVGNRGRRREGVCGGMVIEPIA